MGMFDYASIFERNLQERITTKQLHKEGFKLYQKVFALLFTMNFFCFIYDKTDIFIGSVFLSTSILILTVLCYGYLGVTLSYLFPFRFLTFIYLVIAIGWGFMIDEYFDSDNTIKNATSLKLLIFVPYFLLYEVISQIIETKYILIMNSEKYNIELTEPHPVED